MRASGIRALIPDVAEVTKPSAPGIQEVQTYLTTVLKGHESAVELVMLAMLSGGHALLEGVPGVGKTKLARAAAEVLGGSFRRIQMTSDLLPSEITGGPRPTAGGQGFQFHQGPIFANVVLADELNRASPRTQSALLEAMAEGTVTVDGVTHHLPQPFLVLATQNPQESFGAYPLSESQLDRFSLFIPVGYPAARDELEVYRQALSPQATLNLVAPHLDVQAVRQQVEKIFVEESLLAYVQSVTAATREHSRLATGLSVRGALSWLNTARSRALLEGRDYVIPADLKNTAAYACAHRLRLPDEGAPITLKREILQEIIESLPCTR